MVVLLRGMVGVAVLRVEGDSMWRGQGCVVCGGGMVVWQLGGDVVWQGVPGRDIVTVVLEGIGKRPPPTQHIHSPSKKNSTTNAKRLMTSS